MNDFYMILPSNSNPNTQPNNAANKFIVEWEEPIIFNNSKNWKVALTEFSYYYQPISSTVDMGIKYLEERILKNYFEMDFEFDLENETVQLSPVRHSPNGTEMKRIEDIIGIPAMGMHGKLLDNDNINMILGKLFNAQLVDGKLLVESKYYFYFTQKNV